jgi:3-hydroxybutyryl-CoA dehydratase
MTADSIGVDFDRLDAGTRVVSRGRTITETDLVSFSALTGDWHPQHSDVAWAAGSVFGERIAHGMLVASYAIGLLPIDPERVVALRGLEDVVFKRPARIGDSIRVRAEIASRRPLDAQNGLVTLAARVRNQDDQLLARLTIQAIWRRSAAPVAEPVADAAPAQNGMVLL